MPAAKRIIGWPTRAGRGALAERQRHYALALAQYQKSLTLWQQVPASASHQQIIQERIAAVQSHLSEEPHAEDAAIGVVVAS